MEAVELSLTEATEESKAVNRKTIIYQKNVEMVTKKLLKCNFSWNVYFESFIFLLVANDWSSKCPIKLDGMISTFHVYLGVRLFERIVFNLNGFYT